MPICTNCTAFVECLYTQYSESNIRLEQCPKCHSVADRYVEEDALNLTLDLILMKGLLHLLYNRGSAPRIVEPGGKVINPDIQLQREQGEKTRRKSIFKLGAVLVLVDSFTRWCNVYAISARTSDALGALGKEAFYSFLTLVRSCFMEIVLFHMGIIAACMLSFHLFTGVHKGGKDSGISQEFRLSHISLALIYASLTKLFLLSLLAIWRPAGSSPLATDAPNEDTLSAIYHVFDDDRLNREWLLRNVTGGMSAGFAIRVVLNGRPVVAAFIVLAAWLFKAAVGYMLSESILDTGVDRHWLIFSMP